MDRARAMDWIEQHEARRHTAYWCSEGVLTIGVGFNLEQADARTRIEALGLDFELVICRAQVLSDAHIDALFHDSLSMAIEDAVRLVPSFWEHPEDVQLAMIDMRYQLGLTRFLTFKKMLAALKDKNYPQVAHEMYHSRWARQTPARARDDIALVRGAAAAGAV